MGTGRNQLDQINHCHLICTDAEQYKYGKNRVEADAKKLQSKEEELLKKKEALRNRLAQLRKERKDLRAAIEVNAGMRCFIVLNPAHSMLNFPALHCVMKVWHYMRFGLDVKLYSVMSIFVWL